MPTILPATPLFYREPPSGDVRTADLPRCTDLRITYSIGRNALDDRTEVSFRELEFVVARGGGLCIAHGRYVLVTAAPSADSLDMLDSAAGQSEEYLELADVIAGRCSEGLQTFDRGPILALQYIELRRTLRGRGMGASVGLSVLRLLSRRFRVAMAMWKPYPLQYLDLAPPASRALREEISEATRRLSNHYRAGWGAARLGPVAGSAGFRQGAHSNCTETRPTGGSTSPPESRALPTQARARLALPSSS